ncbi:hypothetical protein QTN46_10315 [Bacillus amyloliquefaciens]|nr:hypothetical protein [Bacillus amyloliquefaciens]MEC1841905.1 hypothetical protein [Bacillus amyloliquefaciens]MEC2051444.1 hypothetical protein [Bacillus amyloliquefaciens]WJM63966.1 hypothetical protein QTN46_10315 [Bacillus amyloliquefaciens]
MLLGMSIETVPQDMRATTMGAYQALYGLCGKPMRENRRKRAGKVRQSIIRHEFFICARFHWIIKCRKQQWFAFDNLKIAFVPFAVSGLIQLYLQQVNKMTANATDRLFCYKFLFCLNN